MKLAKALDLIETGDLLFFQGTALFSRLIRWWTGQKFSHVAAVLRVSFNGNGETPCLFESMEGKGVQLLPLAQYLDDCAASGVAVTWRPVIDPAIDRHELVRYLQSTWGEKYSSWLQFVWSFGLIARWIRAKLGLRIALNPKRPFCSWEVTKALIAAGWRGWTLDPAETTPGDVFTFSCLGPPEDLEL